MPNVLSALGGSRLRRVLVRKNGVRVVQPNNLSLPLHVEDAPSAATQLTFAADGQAFCWVRAGASRGYASILRLAPVVAS